VEKAVDNKEFLTVEQRAGVSAVKMGFQSREEEQNHAAQIRARLAEKKALKEARERAELEERKALEARVLEAATKLQEMEQKAARDKQEQIEQIEQMRRQAEEERAKAEAKIEPLQDKAAAQGRLVLVQKALEAAMATTQKALAENAAKKLTYEAAEKACREAETKAADAIKAYQGGRIGAGAVAKVLSFGLAKTPFQLKLEAEKDAKVTAVARELTGDLFNRGAQELKVAQAEEAIACATLDLVKAEMDCAETKLQFIEGIGEGSGILDAQYLVEAANVRIAEAKSALSALLNPPAAAVEESAAAHASASPEDELGSAPDSESPSESAANQDAASLLALQPATEAE
jgi:chromosome segregation ATPase